MTPRRDIDEMLPAVALHAPKCPDPVALRWIRWAAREYCSRARLWRDIDEITVDRPEWQGLCSIEDASIVSIETAFLNGHKLDPVAVAWLDENRPDWQFGEDEVGTARFVTQTAPNTLTIVPRESGTLKVRLVLQPSSTAFTLPAFLIDEHREEIALGAAGQILMTPAAEFANPELGSILLQQFQSKRATAMVRTAKGQQGARLRTKGSYV